MSAVETFSYLFRKYPWFRTGVILFCLVSVLLGSFFISNKVLKKPLIEKIDPEIGMPGDVLLITGNHFGDERADSFVETGGSRLTASSYISWKNDRIQVQLPPNAQNGLVYVVTRAGRSEPKMFAIKSSIPVPIRPDPLSSTPHIQMIQEKSSSVGKLITIYGANFGNARNTSKVFFAWAGDGTSRTNESIAASENDFDYEFWDDVEIRVRVPDGSVSGNVYVETEKGTSNNVHLEVSNSPGTKTFNDKRTYLVNTSVDLSSIDTNGETTIALRIPRPQPNASQRAVELVSSKPEPVMGNLDKTILQQFDFPKAVNKTQSVSHSFAVTVYTVQTRIQAQAVRDYSDKSRLLYVSALRSDPIVPSDSEEIRRLAKSLTEKETNPYLKARLLFNHLKTNFTVQQTSGPISAAAADLLAQKTGDAYDFAVIYCALLRASGIPSLPVSGVLVDKNGKSRVHWWCEFYLENFGWVPADPALAAGLEYETYQKTENPAEFYFGNLDAQHITFSRGWNSLKQTGTKSKIVFRPKTYAFQSIWEESTPNIERYTSFWGDPVIGGIY